MISVGDTRETIVAVASSSAPAIRGVVRIAGTDALQVLKGIVESGVELPKRPRRVEVALRLGEPLGCLDAEALVWPTERSYTGMPSVELHTVGALPILEAVVAAAIRAGARPARPGEFTLRAFLAGRLDLTQAEAVLGVIDARDRRGLDSALAQLAGNVSRPLRALRADLLDLLADLEAGLDFAEEEIDLIDDSAAAARLDAAAEMVRATIARLRTRHRGADVAQIVLRGPPNAGKSSLLNALVGRGAAIVSDQPGTTRDVVCCETAILGHPVRLLDTAGIESSDGEIGRQSQAAARQSQRTATLTLWCVDRGLGDRPGPEVLTDARAIRVATRCDLVDRTETSAGDTGDDLDALRRQGWIVTSARTGLGLETLAQQIATRLEMPDGGCDFGVAATAARCGDALHRADRAISAALGLLADRGGHELVAGEVRLALSALGEVTGEVYTDDILDRVFSRFCIGK